MKPISCIHNPQLAQPKEVHWRPRPAAARKRVVVVGTGVAGLEAAWVAAARGHDVTVTGSSPRAGGKARLEAALPGRAEVEQVYQYQLHKARQHQVTFNLGQRMDVNAILALNPDAVVLATGSRMRPPASLEAGSDPGTDLRAWAKGGAGVPTGGTVVLFDDDQTSATYAATDELAQRFDRVILMTSRLQLARAVSHVSAIGVYRRLYAERVEIVLGVLPQRFAGGKLTSTHVFTGERTTLGDVDHFIYATPRIVNDELAAPLAALGIETHLVGDCRSPRTMMAAVHEGNRVGSQL